MCGRSIAVALMVAPSNRISDLLLLVPALLAALDDIRRGKVREVAV
jgi:hypothetical protein